MSGTRRKAGLLSAHVEGYRAWLTQRGYTSSTVRNMLKELGQVGGWLGAEELAPSQLNEERIEAFRAARRGAGWRRIPGTRAMKPLLSYLREVGVVDLAVARAPSSRDTLLASYRDWMVTERNLAPATILRYENTARRFLEEQAGEVDLDRPLGLTGADVNAFLLRECVRVSTGSAKGRVAELRSVLRFLYLQGLTSLQLGASVPPVGGWRLATVPPTMSRAQVQQLLDSCRPSTPVIVRDRAIMLLVARLGLRSIEIARLRLEDVDWRAGEVVVRGKGRREDRLPLPVDVGEALVDYLTGRPGDAGGRHLFLTGRAPRGPIRADLVGDVLQRACQRAGVPTVGPHRLRHALAGELLRQGADLVAIGQVLRHQDLATTALYAKVDLAALRQVAQDWPGATR